MLLGHKHQTPFYNERRQLHTWVIGQTGVGKSTALIRWCVDDIKNGFGVSFFDPHGDAIDEILKRIPKSRRKDVILFDPSDLDYPIGFNILDAIPERRRAFVASAVVDCFKAVWRYTNVSTPQLDQFLFNGVRALLDVPDGTLMGLKFLLTSKRYRKKVLSYVRDPAITVPRPQSTL